MPTDRSTDGRARAFLLVAGISFLVVFALPLFVEPYWGADVFGWDTGPETDLGVYFGRCLGAVAMAIEDSQPTVEHLETGLYAVVCALALWCRPPASAEAS